MKGRLSCRDRSDPCGHHLTEATPAPPLQTFGFFGQRTLSVSLFARPYFRQWRHIKSMYQPCYYGSRADA